MFRGMIFGIVFALAALVSAQAATIYVPDDYPIIQDAIDAAVDGDTVIVRPGTYVENIDFSGKEITVMSLMGPGVTVIDGGQPPNLDFRSVVRFTDNETRSSIIQGFTLMNGEGSKSPLTPYRAGGAIFCNENTSPTIRDNIITGNAAHWGCGIYCGDNSSPSISNNVISGNDGTLISYSHGGGLFCDDSSSPEILKNVIENNSVLSTGGGILIASGCGGFIRDNIIRHNQARSGGGISLSNLVFDVVITQNLIAHNSARRDGGGMSVHSEIVLASNIIAGNSAGLTGGGLWCYGTPELVNMTIVGNTAKESGGGLITEGQSSIVNCILWNNDSPQGPEIYIESSSQLSVSYSDVTSGQAGIFVSPDSVLDWGPGNIDADPRFVDPDGRDFHLTRPSPCLNAGNNSAPGIPLQDFEGDRRIVAGQVDMGADEVYPHLYYTGTFTPGGSMDFRIIGFPGAAVTLLLGNGLQDPPQWTPYGFLFLDWPVTAQYLGNISAHGVLIKPVSLPGCLAPGDSHPFQAFSGGMLTNLLVLTVK